MAGVNGNAGIALFLRKMKVALQTRQRFELTRHVRRLGFDFLHAQRIGRVLLQPGLQALAGGRANTVEVEAGEGEHAYLQK